MKLILCLFLVIALTSARSYPLFKQCDSAWGSKILGSGPDTICKAGCLVSSVSMALNSYGKSVGGSANPGTLDAWLKSHSGFSGELFVWGSLSSVGFHYQGKVTGTAIESNVDAGKVVILNVHNGGHWVLATGRSGSNFSVNDPGYATTSYPLSQVKEAAVFTVS